MSTFANSPETHYRRSAAVVQISDRKQGTAARNPNAKKGASVSGDLGLLQRVAAAELVEAR
ncbi:MAG: hypothetical protein AAFV30_03840 [Pseudomonadota bacterium]